MLSTKPYLIRALWDWCCDAGLTPHVTIFVDEHCRVPMDYVRDDTITLNLSPAATSQLHIGNDWVTMNARFGGVPRELVFPVSAVVAIYARENGAGMEFAYEPMAPLSEATEGPSSTTAAPSLAAVENVGEKAPEAVTPIKAKAGRPTLQRIK